MENHFMGGPVTASQTNSLLHLHPVIFGDSLAQGMLYSEARARLPEYGLQGMQVHASIGKPFAFVAARIREAYANGRIPRGGTVVVFAGMNDLTALTSPVWDALSSARSRAERIAKGTSVLEGQVDSFLKWAKDNGLNVVFATIPPCREHKPLRHLGREYSADSMAAMSDFNRFLISRRSGTVRVMDLSELAVRNPDGSRGNAMRRELTSDGMHPNPEGYRIVMDQLIRALNEIRN
jgi:lysophospholipase L1-like esterase